MFTKTKIYILGFLSITLTLLLTATLSIPNRLEPKDGPYGSTEYPPKALAASEGCGGIFIFDLDQKYWGSIPKKVKQGFEDDNVPKQPVNIPSIGFMSREAIDPLTAGAYDTTFQGYSDEKINRILWEGYNIIWYSMKMPQKDVEELWDFVLVLNKDTPTTFMLPYNLDGRSIPFSRDVAFSSWGASQSCRTFNPLVYKKFYEFVKENQPEHGGIPPEAPLDKYNELYVLPEEKVS